MASAKSDAAAFDLEESFRRAAAARAMSMDASRVPGVDSWPVDGFASAEPGRSYAGTSGSGTPVDLSPGSTPTYTPPGPFDSRGGSAHLSPPALDHYSGLHPWSFIIIAKTRELSDVRQSTPRILCYSPDCISDFAFF